MPPSNAYPAPHIIPPKSRHTRTIILLHGRGSTGPEFAAELLREGRSTAGATLAQHLPGCKWVFPGASARRSSVFHEDLTEWFDVHSLTDPQARAEAQVEGLRQGIEYVRGVVARELEALRGDAERLVLGGISQGAAMAVHVLLSGRKRLGGFVGFCGWMPFAADVERIGKEGDGRARLELLAEFYRSTLGLQSEGLVGDLEKEALSTPTFLSSSVDDDIVDVSLGRQAKALLEGLGMRVAWREYADGGHWLNEPHGIDDLVGFLETVGNVDVWEYR